MGAARSHGAGKRGGRRGQVTRHPSVVSPTPLPACPLPSVAGHDWHKPQLTGWYKRLLRDEVLAEWRGAAAARIVNGAAGLAHAPKGRPALPSLHIYCHVNAVSARGSRGSTGLGGWKGQHVVTG